MTKPEKPTLADYARGIGIHRVTLSRLVWGHSQVSPQTARKIAAYLNDPDWRRFVHMPDEQLRREINGDPVTA